MSVCTCVGICIVLYYLINAIAIAIACCDQVELTLTWEERMDNACMEAVHGQPCGVPMADCKVFDVQAILEAFTSQNTSFLAQKNPSSRVKGFTPCLYHVYQQVP